MFKTLSKDNRGLCAKWSCIMGCLGLLILLVIVVALARYISGPGPQRLSIVPDNLPAEVILYKPDQASRIEYFSGRDKNRLQETFSVLGKLVAAKFMSDEKKPKITKIEEGERTKYDVTYSDVWQTIISPDLEKSMDHISIEWNYLQDPFSEIKTFYIANFLDRDFSIKKGSDINNYYTLTFLKGEISGDVEIEYIESIKKIRVLVVVDFPSQNNKEQ